MNLTLYVGLLFQGPAAISGHFKAMEAFAKGNRHLTANAIIEAADPASVGSMASKAARVWAYRILHKAGLGSVDGRLLRVRSL